MVGKNGAEGGAATRRERGTPQIGGLQSLQHHIPPRPGVLQAAGLRLRLPWFPGVGGTQRPASAASSSWTQPPPSASRRRILGRPALPAGLTGVTVHVADARMVYCEVPYVRLLTQFVQQLG